MQVRKLRATLHSYALKGMTDATRMVPARVQSFRGAKDGLRALRAKHHFMGESDFLQRVLNVCSGDKIAATVQQAAADPPASERKAPPPADGLLKADAEAQPRQRFRSAPSTPRDTVVLAPLEDLQTTSEVQAAFAITTLLEALGDILCVPLRSGERVVVTDPQWLAVIIGAWPTPCVQC